MTTNTAALVKQLRDALTDARDDVQAELHRCTELAGRPATDRRLAAQVALALDVDIAIADAEKWLAEQPTNQCGETCERAKLCATCARELILPLQQQPVAPDGWKLVPVEPTPEMISAGECAHWNKERDACSPTPTEFSYDGGGPIGYAWTAMLAAAPQAVVQPLTTPAVLDLMPNTIPARMDGDLLLFARAIQRACADAWGVTLSDGIGSPASDTKPCRCGPDGCADSACPGRTA